MLLVIIFLLSVFMLAQFFLAREVTGKDTVLSKLNRQIEELSQLLALERSSKTEAEGAAAVLSANLEAAQQDKSRMQGLIDADKAGAASTEAAGARAASDQQQLAAQQDLSAKALAQVDILNQQIAALRRQLGAVEAALDASEKVRRRIAGENRRSRRAAQCRPGAEGAGTRPLPLRFLRAAARDPRRPAGR